MALNNMVAGALCDVHASQNIPTTMPKWYHHWYLLIVDLWHHRHKWNTLSFTTIETWHWGYYVSPSKSETQMVWPCTAGQVLYQIYHQQGLGRHGLNVRRLMSSSRCAGLLIWVWWRLRLYYCDGNFRFTWGLRARNRILLEMFLCINFVLLSEQVMISHINR